MYVKKKTSDMGTHDRGGDARLKGAMGNSDNDRIHNGAENGKP